MKAFGLLSGSLGLCCSLLLMRGAETLPPASTPPGSGIPIGWCTRGQPATLDQAKSAGFEYIEVALQDLLPLSDKDFLRYLDEVKRVGIPIRAGYNPIPNNLKLVGPEVDNAKLSEHLKRLLDRAAALQLRYLVFNSAAAWRVPEGVTREQALQQLTNFCSRFSRQAGARGITVLIEPQRSRDTNLITTIAEAMALVRAIDRPSFQLMVDYSFLRIQKDDLRELLATGDHLKDIHIANPEANRTYPLTAGESNYAEFFTLLKQLGYRGGISVHASTTDFDRDAPRAIAFLRQEAAALAKP